MAQIILQQDETLIKNKNYGLVITQKDSHGNEAMIIINEDNIDRFIELIQIARNEPY